jgi:hypothetical protein
VRWALPTAAQAVLLAALELATATRLQWSDGAGHTHWRDGHYVLLNPASHTVGNIAP